MPATLQVTDVFSAVALKGLFEALVAEGCVVVATSNRAPWELPRHGLHEDMFSHFVDTWVGWGAAVVWWCG
jgi:predicted ATPase